MDTNTRGGEGVRRPGMRKALAGALLAMPVAMVVALAAMAGARANLYGQTQAAAGADAAALPAHDSHQGLLVAADPYLTSERSEQRFGKKHPYGAGLLALDVYLRNDSDGPMQVRLETIELKVEEPGQPRQTLEALSAEDAAFRIVLPNGPNPTKRRSPIPGVGGGGKSKDVSKMEASLRQEMLPGDMVGPHNTVHGFVLFDVDRHFDWVKNATLYVPDVKNFSSGEKLFFFEVDLRPAVH